MSRSRTSRLSALVLSMTVVAAFLSMLVVSSASALPSCVSGGGPIVNSGFGVSYADCEVTGNANFGSPGGGVVNFGELTLTNVTISYNSTDVDGGGIYNAGSLTLINVTVVHNTAAFGRGGGIQHHDQQQQRLG